MIFARCLFFDRRVMPDFASVRRISGSLIRSIVFFIFVSSASCPLAVKIRITPGADGGGCEGFDTGRILRVFRRLLAGYVLCFLNPPDGAFRVTDRTGGGPAPTFTIRVLIVKTKSIYLEGIQCNSAWSGTLQLLTFRRTVSLASSTIRSSRLKTLSAPRSR